MAAPKFEMPNQELDDQEGRRAFAAASIAPSGYPARLRLIGPRQVLPADKAEGGSSPSEATAVILLLAEDSRSASLKPGRRHGVADFVATLKMLSDAGQKENAIDLIFKKFDDCMDRDEFDVCDEIIKEVLMAPTALMPTLLVSFLAITLAAKGRVASRPSLLSVADRVLTAAYGEQRARRILAGLR